MKKSVKFASRFAEISLSDKFLIIYLALFFVQIMYNLFSDDVASEQTNAVDVILRTFASAVFGYFLSENFGGTKTGSRAEVTAKQAVPTGKLQADVKNRAVRIGVSAMSGGNGESTRLDKTTATGDNFARTLQVVIVAGVGLLSLVVLIVFRNTGSEGEHVAAVTQLRDMLSSGIGFLVGSKKSG